MRLLVLAEAAQWICPLASLADYKKAFDMVDHVSLLRKLEAYNLDKKRFNLAQIILKWFHSWVSLDCYSRCAQGSWLGPFLSVMFINDLSSHVHAQVDIFADDTTVSTGGPNSLYEGRV